MPLPRLALVAGLAVAGLAWRRRLAGAQERQRQQGSCGAPDGALAKPGAATATVHAYAASTASSAGAGAGGTAVQQPDVWLEPGFVPSLLCALACLLVCLFAVAAVESRRELLAGTGGVLFGLCAGVQLLHLRAQLAAARALAGPVDAAVLVEDGSGSEGGGAKPAPLQDIAGTWLKDPHLSESLDDAMRLVHMSGVVRTAARLIKGVSIGLDGGTFSFGVFSVIAWFKVMERYPLSGEVGCCKRRDMRRGRSRGCVHVARSGALVLEYAWDDPHGGVGRDEFALDEAGRLVVTTTLTVGGASAGYRQVYHRKR